MEDLKARLFAKRTVTPAGCWEFTGARRGGYGRMSYRGRSCTTHRLAAHAWHGLDLSAGWSVVVMHSCDNPPCFNPEHLRMGTQQDNVDDAIQKGRAVRPAPRVPDACPHGHPYTEENTKWCSGRTGRYRRCRTCWRASERTRQQAQNDASRAVPYRPRSTRRPDCLQGSQA